MTTIPVIISVICAAAAVAVLLRMRAERLRLAALCEQAEHFLVYAGKPLGETLDEGVIANMENAVAQLEQRLDYEKRLGARREEQLVRFVENMTHQMKNSVTALQIQLDLLELRMTEEERSSLDKSQACLARLTAEIDRILQSSQLAAGKIVMKLAPLDLKREIELAAERLAPVAKLRESGVALELPCEMICSGDAFWLPQALENIMKNALEHTEEGTFVRVSAEDEGRKLRIRVEDEGRGIPREELGELFRRFHRGSVTKAGYGIGLSMAKDIIEAHHGELRAGNRSGRGAWFEIVLPVLDGARTY